MEKKLDQAERFLEEDSVMFDEFLKENDRNSVAASKKYSTSHSTYTNTHTETQTHTHTHTHTLTQFHRMLNVDSISDNYG